MSYAYLNNKVSSQLLKKVEIGQEFRDYDAFLKFLSKKNKEVEYLLELLEISGTQFGIHLLMEKVDIKYFDFLQSREDSLDRVYYVGGENFYHLFEDCKSRRNYFDYEIPLVVKKKGKEVIQLYRSWFKENTLKGFDDSNLVLLFNQTFSRLYETDKLASEFKFKKIQIELIPISYTTKQYFSLKEFNDSVKEIIRDYNDLDELNYSCESHLNNLKIRAYKLVLEYFKWNYKFEIQDDLYIALEFFNLRRCSICYDRYMKEYEVKN